MIVKKIISLFAIFFAVSATFFVSAKTLPPYRFHKNPEFYLQVQSEKLFEIVDNGLDRCPPVVGCDISRKTTLSLLDALLHDTRNDNTEPFRSFVDSRLKKFVDDLESPHKKGLKIYKIYNEAVIARTKSVNIAFDIARCRCRGFNDPIITDDIVAKIVEKCDILFLSHRHRDHADYNVVMRFIEAGKPVVAAPDIFPDIPEILRYRNEDTFERVVIPLKSGKSLSVTIYPGHQGKMMNNIYVVTTPEKYVVAHSGDQDCRDDVEWISDIWNSSPRIDALVLNSWTRFSLKKVVEGFDARYVIAGHENEMGHGIDHREAFWLTFEKMEPIDCNYVIMAWGEWFKVK